MLSERSLDSSAATAGGETDGEVEVAGGGGGGGAGRLGRGNDESKACIIEKDIK